MGGGHQQGKEVYESPAGAKSKTISIKKTSISKF